MTSNGFGNPQPLVVWPNTTKFTLPVSPNGIIQLSFTEKIELICPNKFSTPNINERNLLAQCFGGTKFILKNQLMDLKNVNCTHYPRYSLRNTGIDCDENGTLIKIGYELEARYFWLIDICHDLELDSTLYAYYHLTSGVQGFQRSVKRPNFSQYGYYDNLNVSSLYSEYNQKKIFAKLLNSQSLADELIDRRKKIVLTRGHLAAKVDFIMGSHQRATHHYINTAPQWFNMNSGNWLKIEDGVRRIVSQRKLFVEIITGTYGVMTMEDFNGNQQEIYLYEDDKMEKHLPIPRYFYKILYDRQKSSGIVFISINNPFLTIEEINSDYILCNDVSNKVKWLRWKPYDLTLGYSYACDIMEFTKIINRHTDILANELFI